MKFGFPDRREAAFHLSRCRLYALPDWVSIPDGPGLFASDFERAEIMTCILQRARKILVGMEP
jgi:hypothetical protein